MSARLSPLMCLGITIGSALILAGWPLVSQASCTLASMPGDTRYTCDSGTSPGLNDTDGNNTLTLPAAGSGRIDGNVTFGAGRDRLEQASGEITGVVDLGDGDDTVRFTGGRAGRILQGNGIDDFFMTGGTIASLYQGDNRDTFWMLGGEILGAFEDGDVAQMSGGRIGRVDMKLDKNIFRMSGGEIVGNLVTGFDTDTIVMSDGRIGGNISVSGGDDSITITGGEVAGEIRAGPGNDRFVWEAAGTIRSPILMAAGNDEALLTGLSESVMASTPTLDGGDGDDTLTFNNTRSASPGRYINWENVKLADRSQLTLGGDFKLGDSVTRTGSLSIDKTSVLLVNQGSISAFSTDQSAVLNNSGLIDMTTGPASATDSLTVNGNYNGNNGQIALQSVLGDDGSPSDKLVVNKGTVQGNTTLSITNLSGPGAETLSNGIQVVEARNGAMGRPEAFRLGGGSMSAGAFEYFLFKGGVTDGTAEHWYLRSTIAAAPPTDPQGPPVPVPVPAEGAPIGLPTAVPSAQPIVLYRPEVPNYSVFFPAVQQMVQAALGTYHERMGDQSQQRSTGSLPAGWGRVYGNSSRQSYAGTVSPRLDSSLNGFQVGSDLYAWTTDNGQTQRVGFFVGHSRLKGTIDGFNRGWQQLDSGKTTLRSDSVGVYWTLIDPYGWYVDAVLMGSRLDGNSESDRGLKLKTEGHDVLASVEIGVPWRVSQRWELEPQLQVIGNQTSLDSRNDGISDVKFSADTAITTRLGVRLRGDYMLADRPFQPYLRANVWHASSGTNRVSFNDVTDIDTEQKSTTLGLKVGASWQVSKVFSVYGEAGYNSNLDSNALDAREFTLGVRGEF
ncbi:autotransporter outer membrane beta-barrel domain-containing protein [Pseudomonas sp. 15FMM2]|uniref:Autotransporter outer membrane beta-barrel domain-containing protein n=1 Tax=Pseudomonas imrae TaxID=2992837 RepID=A0ACC7PC09_9PSED